MPVPGRERSRTDRLALLLRQRERSQRALRWRLLVSRRRFPRSRRLLGPLPLPRRPKSRPFTPSSPTWTPTVDAHGRRTVTHETVSTLILFPVGTRAELIHPGDLRPGDGRGGHGTGPPLSPVG